MNTIESSRPGERVVASLNEGQLAKCLSRPMGGQYLLPAVGRDLIGFHQPSLDNVQPISAVASGKDRLTALDPPPYNLLSQQLQCPGRQSLK